MAHERCDRSGDLGRIGRERREHPQQRLGETEAGSDMLKPRYEHPARSNADRGGEPKGSAQSQVRHANDPAPGAEPRGWRRQRALCSAHRAGLRSPGLPPREGSPTRLPGTPPPSLPAKPPPATITTRRTVVVSEDQHFECRGPSRAAVGRPGTASLSALGWGGFGRGCPAWSGHARSGRLDRSAACIGRVRWLRGGCVLGDGQECGGEQDEQGSGVDVGRAFDPEWAAEVLPV